MKYPELEYVHELPEQFTEIGRGGQAAVYMLTDPALSQPETPPELYQVPRVIKVALGDAAIRGYVRDSIGITDPTAQNRKVDELILHQYITFNHVMKATALNPNMDTLFGRPRYVLPLSPFHHTAEDQLSNGITYTQDYLQPIARLLPKLDPAHATHRQLGRNIVRQYIGLQRHLIPYGLFDTSYKLADNYATDEAGRLRITDFSELCRSRRIAEISVANREWKQLIDRREQTQLPDWLRSYFNSQLQKHLTRERFSAWETVDLYRENPTVWVAMYDSVATNLWLDHVRSKHKEQA